MKSDGKGGGGLDVGVDRVLLSSEQIQSRIAELGEEIARHYDGRKPLLVGVLTGAVVFMADFVRELRIPIDFEFMAVSSYGDATESSGVVQIRKDLDTVIEDREVLIVEDIIDSGLTVRYLRSILVQRGPRDIRVVALLRKERPDAGATPVEWVGFDIPDEFVVGYGLDFAGQYRNLPYVGVLRHD